MHQKIFGHKLFPPHPNSRSSAAKANSRRQFPALPHLSPTRRTPATPAGGLRRTPTEIPIAPIVICNCNAAAPMADLAEAPAVQNKPPEELVSSESRGNKTKRDDAVATAADPSDAKRSRPAAGGGSTQQAFVLYKPQTQMTRPHYEGMLGAIQHHLGGQPFDVLAGVAHGVLAALKNHQLDPGDKKKAIDRLFRGTIPNQLFDYLVFTAYFITDFHGAPPAPAVDATLHDNHVPELDDRGMDFILSLDDDEDDITYKPKTNETRAAYRALFNVVMQHISRDNPLDVKAWVVDKLLATLKDDELDNTAKKKEIEEEWLLKRISNEFFDQLVSMGKLITDYHGAATGLEGRDSCKTTWSRGTVDTSSSSEPVSQEETEMKHDEQTAQILSTMKRQKIQIMRDMLDLQKREMEWRKKQHEETISLTKKQHEENISLRKKQLEENISLRKKDIELRQKQVEAKLITAEAGIMAIDIQTVPPYMKSYYIGMQRQIMERREFATQLSFVGQVLSPSAEPPK